MKIQIFILQNTSVRTSDVKSAITLSAGIVIAVAHTMSKFWNDEPIKQEEEGRNILPGLDAGDLAVLYDE